MKKKDLKKVTSALRAAYGVRNVDRPTIHVVVAYLAGKLARKNPARFIETAQLRTYR